MVQKNKIEKTVVVDFLDLGNLFLLLKIPKNSRVLYLFKSRVAFIESILIFICKLRRINLKYKKLQSKVSYRAQSDISDKLARDYVSSIKVINEPSTYFYQRIGDFVYTDVYRSVSILEFIIFNLSNENIDKVIIAKNKFSNEILNLYKKYELNFYTNIGYPKDDHYQTYYSPNDNFLFKSFFKSVIKIFNSLFNITIYQWPKTLNISLIGILHPVNRFREFLSQNEIFEVSEQRALFLNNLTLQLPDKRKLRIRRVTTKNFRNFIDHILSFKKINQKIKKIALHRRLELFSDFVDSFYLSDMIKILNTKVIYSVYESNKALLLLNITTSNKTCVSLVSSFSAGYFPAQYHISHKAKNVDVYFVWGRLLSKLIRASGDMSRYHFLTGYTGNKFIERFLFESRSFFNGRKNPIIAIYDSTFFEDLFINRRDMENFITKISEFAINEGFNVIIKTKKLNNFYETLINRFPDRIEISNQLGSLSAGFAADLTIGYLVSSPLIALSSYKKSVVFFDPDKISWNKYYDQFSNFFAMSFQDVFNKILNCKKLNSDHNMDFNCFNSVNYLSEHKYQAMVADYISFLISSDPKDKILLLNEANLYFEGKYGKSRIIETK